MGRQHCDLSLTNRKNFSLGSHHSLLVRNVSRMAPWVWIQLILIIAWSVLWVPTCWSVCSLRIITLVLLWSFEDRDRAVNSLRYLLSLSSRWCLSPYFSRQENGLSSCWTPHHRQVSLAWSTQCICFHICAYLLVSLCLRSSQMHCQDAVYCS